MGIGTGRLAALSLAAAIACGAPAHAAQAAREVFAVTPERPGLEAVVLTNGNGMKARILAAGATLQTLEVPDAQGRVANVVRSYPTVADYRDRRQVAGAVIGRYANRIAGASIELDGRTYPLASGGAVNASHGGPKGFDTALWTIARLNDGPQASVTLTLTSPDGDQGFPGEMKVTATYSLDEKNVLTLRMEATTTRPTVINLTNHSYFNLAGEADGGDAMDHLMTVRADAVTVVGPGLIPTGAFRQVAGTPFDFRTAHRVGERIGAQDEQLLLGRGYDHNFVIRGGATARPKPAVRLEDPKSGRVLELSTTEPGIQIYTGLKGSIALEPQHYPDSPHHPNFPSTRLDPGRTFRHVTVYKFPNAYTKRPNRS